MSEKAFGDVSVWNRPRKYGVLRCHCYDIIIIIAGGRESRRFYLPLEDPLFARHNANQRGTDDNVINVSNWLD